MFTTLIVKPIFNLLVLIYTLIPGHNFGLAIILFTILIRLLMWPLVRKQLHHAKAMRELQPEIKKIKQAAAGDRQKESRMIMELYKERQIKPLGSLGLIAIQIIILLGLYRGLYKVINDPHQIISFSYGFLHHLPWLQTLSHDIHRFDNSLFGLVDLSRTALGTHGIYWAAMVIVVASALAQYFQSKQLMPKSQDSRGLRQILREAGSGKNADQAEVNAAVSRGTIFLIPFFIFVVSLRLAAALPLYWLASSTVAYFQQDRALKGDVEEAQAVAKQVGGVKVTRSTISEAGATKAAPRRKKRSRR